MGTLGFLTPFESGEALATLERVLAADHAPVFCTLRTRRRCEVVWCARGAAQPPYPTLLHMESVRDAAGVEMLPVSRRACCCSSKSCWLTMASGLSACGMGHALSQLALPGSCGCEEVFRFGAVAFAT